jgi:hypothetical protein
MVKITEEILEREGRVRDVLEEYSELFDIDPNLVRALITQESRFIPTAKSPTGAFGYGQFTNIAAKQVQIIASMTPLAADLKDFQKAHASEPKKGIKAICATLWWLFHKKYEDVGDKKTQLEACLTFYNAGGKVAALVVKHGGHAKALPFIKQIPANERSQGDKYAPELLQWFVAWHELTAKPAPAPEKPKEENPFEDKVKMDIRYSSLIHTLKLLGELSEVDVLITSRDNMTEITLIVPGEL